MPPDVGSLPEKLRDDILHEARLLRQVEKDVYAQLGEDRTYGGYAPWTLQFENAVLFLPSCVEFMQVCAHAQCSHLADVLR